MCIKIGPFHFFCTTGYRGVPAKPNPSTKHISPPHPVLFLKPGAVAHSSRIGGNFRRFSRFFCTLDLIGQCTLLANQWRSDITLFFLLAAVARCDSSPETKMLALSNDFNWRTMECDPNAIANPANNLLCQVSVRLEVAPPAKLHLFKVSVVQIVKVLSESLVLKSSMFAIQLRRTLCLKVVVWNSVSVHNTYTYIQLFIGPRKTWGQIYGSACQYESDTLLRLNWRDSEKIPTQY